MVESELVLVVAVVFAVGEAVGALVGNVVGEAVVGIEDGAGDAVGSIDTEGRNDGFTVTVGIAEMDGVVEGCTEGPIEGNEVEGSELGYVVGGIEAITVGAVLG